MATLTVTQDEDYRDGPPLDPNSPTDQIVFQNAASATFGSNQFGDGNGKIANNLAVTGSAGINTLRVNLSATGTFSAESWTFSNWSVNDFVSLSGTAGDDTIIGSSKRDGLLGGAGNDTLFGGDGADLFTLNASAQLVAGEDYDGGNGTDQLNVTSGTYDFRAVNVISIERLLVAGASVTALGSQFGAGGITWVFNNGFGSHSLAVNGGFVDLSDVTFHNWNGAVTINGTDPALNNLIGSSENDTINGTGASVDFMRGGDGADTLNGGLGGDFFIYDAGSEAVAGETINAGAGFDTIQLFNGDAIDFSGVTISGMEELEYSSGNATATLLGTQIRGNTAIEDVQGSSATDRLIVNAAASQGIDLSGVDFAFWTNGIDQITINGSASDENLTGSSQSDRINGAAGADTLTGRGGNDTYILDTVHQITNEDDTVEVVYDTVVEAADGGVDTVRVQRVSGIGNPTLYTLAANVENGIIQGTQSFNLTGNPDNNSLTGNAAANILKGAAGADILIGGIGNDTMDGGIGNDLCSVDSASDVVKEALGGGTDRVNASVSYTLAGGQEVETLSTSNTPGTAAINLTGNGFANSLIGNAGANFLNGGAGADVITTHGGNDTVRFNTALGASNVDTISDLDVTKDIIQLENAIFIELTTNTGNALSGGEFFVGSAAHDADDRIIYNSATGALIYDTNGNAAGGATQFATLATGLGLTSADFFVV